MAFVDRLSQARDDAAARWQPLGSPYPACVLFMAVSDGKARARVVHASGPDFASTWRQAAVALTAAMKRHKLSGHWLRVEWVTEAQATSRAALQERLRKTKRNYFRQGLAFDAGFRAAITEQEINGHAIFYGGSTVAHATLNDSNLATFAAGRFAGGWSPPDEGWHTFKTAGVFVDHTGCHPLSDVGLSIGRRNVATLDAETVARLVRTGSDFLAHQVDAEGRFIYGHFPCFDRQVAGYNTLRHASTVYAMTEAWGETRCPRLGQAIERALGYVTRECVHTVGEDADGPVAMLVDVDHEIKLGGNAVLILALTRHAAATGSTQGLALAEALARGIRRMQDAGSGSFVHVLHHPSLAVKARHRIIYYDGEAAFALMRLYQATGNPTWLAMVEKAFSHFIAAEHWRAHDHWLSYCVNELTRYRPERAYFAFGLRNIEGYLDFIANRVTTFPTLLELTMAARAMLERLASEPALADLYRRVDIPAFEAALEQRAHRMLDGYFWPEFAMSMRQPDKILGAFFIRHHAFRVRIDDVEHYLSGLIAYLDHVRRGRPALPRHDAKAATLPDVAVQEQSAPRWTAESVAHATGGHWLHPPPPGWQASGVCMWLPSFTPGDMLMVRGPNQRPGVLPSSAASRAPATWISQDDALPCPSDTPWLKVESLSDALMQLGRHARAQLTAPVIAVTGSAGKTTTVAMLAQGLSGFGTVGQTRHNANLPHGIAWNIASLPADARHVVLELAIGRMGENARLTRPDIAVFTNIAPAHLIYHHDLRTVAAKKSAIFDGMAPGAVAVINADMAHADLVMEKARARGLTVVTYGRAPEADVRLRDYAPATGTTTASLGGQSITLRLRAPGEHLAMNALAVLAVAHTLSLPLPRVIDALGEFAALPGRGDTFTVDAGGKTIRIVDDSYNANPASMAAALEIARQDAAQAKLLVLGDMLELGEDEVQFHSELAAAVRATGARRIVLCGPLMQHLAARLEGMPVHWYSDADAVLADLDRHLAEVDYVMVKSSGGTRLSAVVTALRERGRQDQAQAA